MILHIGCLPSENGLGILSKKKQIPEIPTFLAKKKVVLSKKNYFKTPTLPETNSSPMKIPIEILVNTIKIRWIFQPANC